MRIAFLNLCHCEPEIVARAARKLCAHPDFDMYIHVDEKQDIASFLEAVKGIPRVYFTGRRYKVYWGGYHAILATMELLRDAFSSQRHYDYFVTLQNLDYPIRSNMEIADFFEADPAREYIRGCNIAHTKVWEFARKYRLYYKKDTPLGGKNQPRLLKLAYNLVMGLLSCTTIFHNGVIRENGEQYEIHYGCAQWAVTRACAEYILKFHETHPKFNRKMAKMQFPDEEYVHTIVHNSPFKEKNFKYNEPMQKWLVNWRNLHYFEFPKEVTVLDETYYEKIMSQQGILFCRKVKSGVSDKLLEMIDRATEK
ncbi:MAG: beta-1,6-N-acetylglucosaminyltransferase [Acetatifactor sp.]|nr:beta-1,6-N-acetylglucosaminyltransferase [Acetatifactor sp.]